MSVRPYSPGVVGRACDLLNEWTGFELRGTAPRRVKEFLASRAERVGMDGVESYVARLEDASPTDEEPQRLINLITNGLTAFWRDEPQLGALRSVVQKASHRKRDGRPVTVWCAGASTGEEAYTVAMVADEVGVSVDVLGTDINTDFLGHARKGVYGTFSLRRLDEERIGRYFEEVGANRWALIPRLRESVTFERRNLLDSPPSPSTGAEWDVIMCRNVFIYLAPEAVAETVDNFASRLHPDGYLLLGSSEQLDPDSHIPFRAARHGRGFVYRRVETAPGRSASLPPISEHEDPREEIPRMPAHSLEEETTDFQEDEAVVRLLNAGVEHLNATRRETALACFEAAAGYDPFVPETYCLLGIALHGAGAPDQAVEAYEKALFLDPMIWFAAWQAARLHEEAGDVDRAVRMYRQALEGFDAKTGRLFDARLVGEEFRRVEDHRAEAKRACRTALDRLTRAG